MAKAREEEEPKRHRIFTYGTLKRGFANHKLMQELINHNDAVFLGNYSTQSSFPLVLGPNGIPYLINLPVSGRPVRGELYAVSNHGVARLDELEETSIAHYDRLPVQVVGDSNGGETVVIKAECYFAGKGAGEGLWNGKDGEGLEEYTEREAVEFMRKDQTSKRLP
ncbi:putative gamma-glutamylcyclotransferase At3g02910 [Benincasa hispida]|uniref:putative gamma-glutamylcyclotransferase At3g02910 n=1 Tax=Benincasa hispida TaxID=102211 RepID=UPI00190298C7|nr:putative gamma-glutamylcyclotransferase At3g02910 [Benincasa hispida]